MNAAPAVTMTADQARALRRAHDADARILSRMSAASLRGVENAELAAKGTTRLFGGPQSKDELISSILNSRYPITQLNQAIHVMHHEPGQPWSACQWCHPHAGTDCECELGRG